MGYLQDIISEASSNSVDVPRLLRLCLILGHRLKYEPLINWARMELDGYPSDIEVPAYRSVSVLNKGRFAGQWSGVFELPLIRLPENMQVAFSSHDYRSGVAELSDLIQRSSAKSSGSLHVPWPVELANHYYSDLIAGSSCIAAWREISVSAFAGTLDQITTRILDFALSI
ncbi:MAG: hypothetical protein EON58_23440, partial [Alphaproteobacteria bacterium]